MKSQRPPASTGEPPLAFAASATEDGAKATADKDASSTASGDAPRPAAHVGRVVFTLLFGLACALHFGVSWRAAVAVPALGCGAYAAALSVSVLLRRRRGVETSEAITRWLLLGLSTTGAGLIAVSLWGLFEL